MILLRMTSLIHLVSLIRRICNIYKIKAKNLSPGVKICCEHVSPYIPHMWGFIFHGIPNKLNRYALVSLVNWPL